MTTYKIKPARPALARAALACVRDSHLGQTWCNPDDHAHFLHEGQRYTVQQIRPHYLVVHDDNRRVLKIKRVRRAAATPAVVGHLGIAGVSLREK